MKVTKARTYLRTHPWLTFAADLKRAPAKLWMLLGAIQSKCEHVANAMLPPNVAKELHTLFLAKGVHATTAIEGNTLTEEQVRARINKMLPLPESKEYQGQEVDNIVAACNTLAAYALDDDSECQLTAEMICKFNKQVLVDLPVEEGVVPGAIRKTSVGVADYRGAPAEDCEFLLRQLCDWINESKPAQGDEVTQAVLQAVLAHLYLAWIHPFGDGNGRTARLVEVLILFHARVPTVAAHLLSNHYNQTRSEYYRQLSRASKSGGDVFPFLQYAAQGFYDGLNGQIDTIRKFQTEMTWRDYVYSQFRDQSSVASARQRAIALAMGLNDRRFFSSAQIRLLTPELAQMYAHKTAKTVSRDLNKLRELKLIQRTKRGHLVRANTDLLRSFLPKRRKKSSPQ